jgi:N-methylhydantoinase A
MTAKTMRVATDVGGTFTDLVCFETDEATGESRITTAKSDTTPPDFEQGVLNVIDKAGSSRRDRFPGPRHHRGHQRPDRAQGRQGRADHHRRVSRFTLEIARGNRPDFFNLSMKSPSPSCRATCAANCPVG